jgi:hypothetical protein
MIALGEIDEYNRPGDWRSQRPLFVTVSGRIQVDVPLSNR